MLGAEVVTEEGVSRGGSPGAEEASTRDASASGRRRAACKGRRVFVGVVHFRAASPGGPVIVAVVVEKVGPGKGVGTAVPQFERAGEHDRVVGARVGAT